MAILFFTVVYTFVIQNTKGKIMNIQSINLSQKHQPNFGNLSTGITRALCNSESDLLAVRNLAERAAKSKDCHVIRWVDKKSSGRTVGVALVKGIDFVANSFRPTKTSNEVEVIHGLIDEFKLVPKKFKNTTAPTEKQSLVDEIWNLAVEVETVRTAPNKYLDSPGGSPGAYLGEIFGTGNMG